MRVGKNQATHRAVLRGNLWFDPAPRMVIARNDNLALYGHAHALEPLVVFRHAVVHVHQRRRHVAVNRIRVVRGELLRLLTRGRVHLQRRLLQLGNQLRPTLDEFHGALLRRGKQYVKLLDVRVQAKLFEFPQDPFGIVLIVR